MLSNIYTSCEPSHLSENWGFYVDIENLNHSPNEEKYKFQNISKHNKYKKYDKANKYCETIYEEDEYCCKQDKCRQILGQENMSDMIVNVSSTTFITAILTYVIFFII
jgi:hypothetical protein